MSPAQKVCQELQLLTRAQEHCHCHSPTMITGGPNICTSAPAPRYFKISHKWHPLMSRDSIMVSYHPSKETNGTCEDLWTLEASPPPTPYSGIKMPLNISAVTNRGAGWTDCEMPEQNLFQMLSLMRDPVLWKKEKGEPSGSDQQTYLFTELAMPKEELRNLTSEGDFTIRDSNIVWCWHFSCSQNFISGQISLYMQAFKKCFSKTNKQTLF